MMRRVVSLLALAVAGCTASTARLPHEDGVFRGRQVFTLAWRAELVQHNELFAFKPQEFGSPVSDGKFIYVGTSDGWFSCLDQSRGTLVWRYKTEGVIDAPALLVPEDGTLYFGAGDGHLHALDAATGRLVFKQRLKGVVRRQPAYANGRIFVATDEDKLFALDARSGKILWQYEREQPESFTIYGHAAPCPYEGKVFAGFADGYLVALSEASGEVVWSRSLAAVSEEYVDVDATPVVHGGVLYASSHSGGLYALNPRDGTVHWRYDIVGAGRVVPAGNLLYVTAPQAGLHVLDLQGRLLWRQGLGKAGCLSPPLVVAQYAIFSGSDAGLFVVDREKGTLLQFFSPGGGISGEPILVRRDIVFLSNRGFLYRLRMR